MSVIALQTPALSIAVTYGGGIVVLLVTGLFTRATVAAAAMAFGPSITRLKPRAIVIDTRQCEAGEEPDSSAATIAMAAAFGCSSWLMKPCALIVNDRNRHHWETHQSALIKKGFRRRSFTCEKAAKMWAVEQGLLSLE